MYQKLEYNSVKLVSGLRTLCCTRNKIRVDIYVSVTYKTIYSGVLSRIMRIGRITVWKKYIAKISEAHLICTP